MTFTSQQNQILNEIYLDTDRETICLAIGNKPWSQIKKHCLDNLNLHRPRLHSLQLKSTLDSSPLNAYLWGLIYSDGHITEKGILKIKLHSDDTEYLQNLASIFNWKTRREGKMIVIEAMDMTNGIKLKTLLNLKKQKTYNPPDSLDFLTSLQLKLCFLIGLIDGDGCISYRKDQFQSIRIEQHGNWFSIWKEFFEELGFGRVILNTRGFVNILICGRENFINLKTIIEENNLPILKRKWQHHD